MKDDDSISELGHLSMYTQWIDTKKWWFFFLKKGWKHTFRRSFYRYKTYETILKFNFEYPPIRHIDCLGKFFKAVIYRYEGVVIFYTD